MAEAPNNALHRTPAAAPLSPVSFQTLDDGRVRSALMTCLLLIALTVGCATTAQHSADGGLSASVVGFWQFPERWVWIKVLPDGRVFQCRIDPAGEVFRSEGVLTSDGKIKWQNNWGTETVVRDGDGLKLTGKRTFRYVLARTETKPACNAPF
jgi:hypothetical protein